MELELESSLGLVGSVSRVRLLESGPAPRSLDFGGSTAAAVESGELGERGALAERHLWALGGGLNLTQCRAWPLVGVRCHSAPWRAFQMR